MTDEKTSKSMEEKLQEAARHTDTKMEPTEPALAYFENLIEEQTALWYRRLWFELTCLWGSAFIFISFLIFSLFYVPLLFVLAQVISIIVLIRYFYKERYEMVEMRQ
ncbi:YxlC family protein [Halobacillus sp. Nhm2S1]|uniref:YxlC family protein n=1 Tax=Halobacillus sp. Nhm2S1 TaxID=2866716 RepID=UPI001C72CEBA|nr:YxlC family protein [Halobacillus sp. Nhm2S1]MBX0359175.1 YxlC family protein [Halobacillus sp. Nhm2S1]